MQVSDASQAVNIRYSDLPWLKMAYQVVHIDDRLTVPVPVLAIIGSVNVYRKVTRGVL